MREDDNWRIAAEAFDVIFQPAQLLVAELSQPAGLEVKHIDQSNEMDAVLVEAVPAGALGFDAL